MKVRILINHNYLRRRQYWLAKGGYKDLPKADIATFLWMIANYQAAAQLRTPSENPEERTLIIDGDALSFPDNSMNRGMLAISREAKDLGVDPGIFMERFMGQVEITKWRSVWNLGACRKSEDGKVELSEAFLYSLAQSRYRGGFLHRGFDRGDVVRNMKCFAYGKLRPSVYSTFEESLNS